MQLPATSNQLPASSFQSAWGDVRVISQTTGYKIIRRTTQEVLGFGQVELPEQILETQACWLLMGPELVERLKAVGAGTPIRTNTGQTGRRSATPPAPATGIAARAAARPSR